MKSAIKDKNGNTLRPNYRIEHNDGRQGTIIGMSQPWSVVVRWDNDEEETVNTRLIAHLSKLA